MKKQVLVSVQQGETRVATLEASGEPAPAKSRRGRRRTKREAPPTGYRVTEVFIERRGAKSIVGNIYKGKVDNVLPGLEAAFVDIGLEKNGFIHVDEIVLPGMEPQRRSRGKGSQRITDLLTVGQEIVAQVIKDPLKSKGPRLSMEITIAGRYLVYSPTGEGIGVSRRLEDKERDRLRTEVKQLDLSGGGAIVRTAAHGATSVDFERELRYLQKLNEVLDERVKKANAPAMVFQEADLPIRVVRDVFSADFERAVLDDEKAYDRLVGFFSRTAPELVDRVELWKDKETAVFDAYGVEPIIAGILQRRVDLPSGGYLMIEHTEALTVIDVNTGSFTGGGRAARLEDTITQTNLEAADEVVRQLRLRDIGGIIVIDFIDMARSRNREAVLKTLRAALNQDRTKTFVVEISPLGLVEMTRQNITDGVREILTKPCPTCKGTGVMKSEETIAYEVERKLVELAHIAGKTGPEAYLVRLNSRVISYFLREEARFLHHLEKATGCYFHFEGSEGLPLDHFAITLEGTLAEVQDRAVPFGAGDEVLVDIVEPHMYNSEDAVAKIDSYIVSVSGGGPFVGQKKLVRIKEAGRTSATADLVRTGGDENRPAGGKTNEKSASNGLPDQEISKDEEGPDEEFVPDVLESSSRRPTRGE